MSCAALVLRDDPRLHATALFAPAARRDGLFALYAFDCELSRAVRASKESVIPRMRLQWWRDTIEDAAEGGAEREHEVAGPLHAVIDAEARTELVPLLLDLIEAREQELEAPFGQAAFERWADLRFGSIYDAASVLVAGTPIGARRPVALAAGTAFALRTASAMVHDTLPSLLPDLGPRGRSEIASGKPGEALFEILAASARTAAADLRASRNTAKSPTRRVVPALLPLLWTDRTLRIASHPGFALGQLDDIDRPFDGLRLLWRAASGRW